MPYDRPLTTMAGFAMCAPCAGRVRRPGRPPVPRPADLLPGLRPAAAAGRAPDGTDRPGEPIAAAAALLRDGAVLAVKGLGGYHLAVDAASERRRGDPARPQAPGEDKPFAVMVADLAAARALADARPGQRRC